MSVSLNVWVFLIAECMQLQGNPQSIDAILNYHWVHKPDVYTLSVPDCWTQSEKISQWKDAILVDHCLPKLPI